ncbi:hypothetical protein NDU88_001636 [Pleurodeles waltl]|uniref:Uncharacterized protein n=1 Tax=Pleurodeles waltl TaxID=8319 RepID=A0AAV7UTA6_PLEWA|nr:hypothetical protein NDU88_001636 [Pleurodeles waltl]
MQASSGLRGSSSLGPTVPDPSPAPTGRWEAGPSDVADLLRPTRQAGNVHSQLPDYTSRGPPGPTQPAQLLAIRPLGSPLALGERSCQTISRSTSPAPKAAPPQLTTGSNRQRPQRAAKSSRPRQVCCRGGPLAPSAATGSPRPQEPLGRRQPKIAGAAVRFYCRSGPHSQPPDACRHISTSGSASPHPRPPNQARRAHGRAPRVSRPRPARPFTSAASSSRQRQGHNLHCRSRQHLRLRSAAQPERQKNSPSCQEKC